MPLLSPGWAILVMLLALASSRVVWKLLRLELPGDRIPSIDGLRGYLAMSVFLHHAAFWYFYGRGSEAFDPPSNFYTHLGQTSVSVFFMITGFLFFEKVALQGKPVDWVRLYASRILRLTPAYLMMVSLMLLVVGAESHWTLREPAVKAAWSVLRWLLFSGGLDINQINNTSMIIGGVTWTLTYEWVFYLALPLIAMLARRQVAWQLLLLAGFALVYSIKFKLRALLFLPFLGGMTGAYVARQPWALKAFRTRAASVVAVGLMGMVIYLETTAYTATSMFLTSMAFILIACGNSLFGILTRQTSRMMGEMTYSIYLLHGFLFYMTFNHVLGLRAMTSLTPLQHWVLILSLTPVLILLSGLSYKFVELPAMQHAPRLAARLRRA